MPTKWLQEQASGSKNGHAIPPLRVVMSRPQDVAVFTHGIAALGSTLHPATLQAIHPPSHNAPGKSLESEREPRGDRASGKGETSCVCVSEREASSGCAQWRCTTVLKLLCWVRGELSPTLARKCAQLSCSTKKALKERVFGAFSRQS